MEFGQHVCALYDNEDDHRAVLAPFIQEGLAKGHKIRYIADAHTLDVIRSYADVTEAEKDGRFGFLSRDESYMRGGVFDPDRMIATLRAETDRAVAEGYPGLRVTGEMTWALRGLPGAERLIEYEAKLNLFFPGSKCMAICQYDMRRFPPALLLDVLRSHPIACVGHELYANHYYIPPEQMLSEELQAAELKNWLANLAARGEMDRRLRARTEELEAANRDLEDFAHSASHDLKAPLRALNGYVGLLARELEGKLGGDSRAYFEAVLRSTARMEEIVNALLALGRVGKAAFNRRTVDLTGQAREIIEDLRRAEPGRHVRADVEDGLREEADAGLTRVILQNLLGNAWKFTGRKPEASIRFGREGAALYVRDNGAGFDPALSDRLFKPFRRLHTTADFPGTGVGLATVQRAVARHGGFIRAEGRPEQGATFWFTLKP